jgi:death-on-curing protein
VIYLSFDEALIVATRALGAPPEIRDPGLLESALARPQASVFGSDAYPDIWTKAAALFESLARNHALIDGNKRLALAGLIAFLGVNGHRLTCTNDQAYDFTMEVCQGFFADVSAIAAFIQANSQPR